LVRYNPFMLLRISYSLLNPFSIIMEPWYPIVIGTVVFCYVQSYNRIAKLYFESGKTLDWSDFFTKVIPIRDN